MRTSQVHLTALRAILGSQSAGVQGLGSGFGVLRSGSAFREPARTPQAAHCTPNLEPRTQP